MKNYLKPIISFAEHKVSEDIANGFSIQTLASFGGEYPEFSSEEQID